MDGRSPATRIILDTDLAMGVPGSDIDDGFALALALAEPSVTLEAITTVNGNADVESATLLSVELLERLGASSVPVYRGASAPLAFPDRRRSTPEAIRAQFGHRQATPGYAAVELVTRAAAEPGLLTVVAIGPLTNLAAAVTIDPDFATNVREIVIMGGVFLGHTHETRMPGEFNFWNDPEAADAVLRSGATIRIVGLDVTEQVRLTRGHAEAMRASSSSFSQFAGTHALAWIDHLASWSPGSANAGRSCAMHDPLAVAVLAHPELVTWRRAHVEVVTGPGIARGGAVADLLAGSDPPTPNVKIAVNVDVNAFLDYFLSSLHGA